jgi:hypothetical protein
MNSKALLAVLVLIVGLVILFSINGASAPSSEINTLLAGEKATIYKDISCGCCAVYASYLESNNVDVDVQNVADLEQIKEQFEIPHSLQSCHTMEVGGYVVEGHVPLEVVGKLLTEKPDIKGIALPGMPSGSPGMPGPKTAPFVIYVIGGAEGEIYTTI